MVDSPNDEVGGVGRGELIASSMRASRVISRPLPLLGDNGGDLDMIASKREVVLIGVGM